MAWPEYAVPLTLHDMPARETYMQITTSLQLLQKAVNSVFARIEDAVESRRGEDVRHSLRIAVICPPFCFAM